MTKTEFKNLFSKEQLTKIKDALLKMSAEPTIVEVKFEDIPLADGKVLQVEKIEVGAKANIVTPEGIAPAPDGEHLANDGSTIVIVDGSISEIKPKAQEPEAEIEVEMNNDKSELEALKAELEALKAKYLGLSKDNESFKTQLSEVKSNTSLALEAVNTIVEAPVVNADNEVKNTKAWEDLSPLERRRATK